MIIIIDFDDILFDRKGKFTQAAKQAGLDITKGDPLYESCKVDGNYDYRKHIRLIAGKDTPKEKELLDKMERVFQNTSNFLFDGTTDFLKNLKQKGYRLILTTKGKIDFQKKKVENSGLERFFEETLYTEKYKADFLADKIKKWHKQEEEIVLLDDSEKEIELMKQKFPYVRAIQIKPGSPFPLL